MLDGFKTYLIAAIAILSAILAYFAGELSLLQALEAIGLAIGVSGTRAVAAVRQFDPRQISADPEVRKWLIYGGVALSILSAILAGINGEQDPVVTISTVLGALGINFLGIGVKKAVQS